jgi:hypothetical protein
VDYYLELRIWGGIFILWNEGERKIPDTLVSRLDQPEWQVVAYPSRVGSCQGIRSRGVPTDVVKKIKSYATVSYLFFYRGCAPACCLYGK